MVSENGSNGSNGQHRKQKGRALFSLGMILATPGAMAAMILCGINPAILLDRHSQGDWGDLDAEDKAANDRALKDGSRIFSAYKFGGLKFWVITESDRSSTTILLPEEY